MKSSCFMRSVGARFVTLCVRVWIEIWKEPRAPADHLVTLCVRVWIEIL